jgi:hypothetical protein
VSGDSDVARIETREAWLLAAVDHLRSDLRFVGAELPERLQISVGFPRGRRRAIGQCFASEVAVDGRNHLFISPALDDPVDVLGALVHELIHAADDCASGHRRFFARIARDIGLRGPMHATHPGEELLARLNELAAQLGPYPHGALKLEDLERQSTRLIKATCEHCGYVVRVTRIWLAVGPPHCPAGIPMVPELPRRAPGGGRIP